MRRAPGLLSILLAAAPASAAAQAPPAAAFAARNTLDIRRDDEVVSLPWTALADALPGLAADAVRAVRAGAGEELPSQPLDLDGDGTPEELLVLTGFRPGETVVIRVEAAAASRAEPRVHVYHDAERDDVAWESDRIAFRTYGQGLWALEELVSSGIDVLTKRVPDLVLERWYAGGDYHTDHGEGADFFSVGSTLGAGGAALVRGGALHPAQNFAGYRILADGPIRAVVQLEYDPYPAGDLTVTETRRISMDAGSWLFRQETRYDVTERAPGGEWAALARAVGIVRRPGLVSSWSPGPPAPWLAAWQPVANGGHGHLGTAILLDPGVPHPPPAVRDIDGHAALVQPIESGVPAVHWVGAAWTAAGPFLSPADWWRYLDGAAARLASPIEVTPVVEP